MPVFIDSIKFYNEFRPEPTTWLLGNVGDKVTAEVEVRSLTAALPTDQSNAIKFGYNEGVVGFHWMQSDHPWFADFNVGDQIVVTGTGGMADGTFTIIQKLDDYSVQVNGPFLRPCISWGAKVYLTTPITGFKYLFGLIENAEAANYFSKIDNQPQMFYAEEVDASDLVTVQTMGTTGLKSWQIGGATIQGMGVSANYEFKFKVIHTFYITPFMLADQWDALIVGTAPTYFLNGACLKYALRAEALFEFTNPNRVQIAELSEVLGNTGWFNENFNNRPTNFWVDSVTFKRAGGAVIPAPEMTTADQTVEIVIKNTADAPFSNLNTKFVLNFIEAPETPAEYQNNGNTIAQNFWFDRAAQTVGAPAVNGEQFGTTQQVLKNITAVWVNNSEVKITATIALAQAFADHLSGLDNPRFILWVATQNHTMATADADRVALMARADAFYFDASDPGLIVQTNKFIRHPHNDPTTEGRATITVLPMDEVVGHCLFYIDKNGRENDAITITSVEARIIAKETATAAEFVLDKYKLPMVGLPVIGGLQYVDFSQNRPFLIPADEIRRPIKVKRRTDLDAGGLYYYEMFYPWLNRWEYWAALAGVNGAFFDPGQPNNGLNHDWTRYGTAAGWALNFEVIIKVNKNGDILTFTKTTPMAAADYDQNPAWEPDTLKAYDADTNQLLFDAGSSKNFILGYKDARVEAVFTDLAGGIDPNKIAVVFGVEVYEEGGITGRRRYSSKWPTVGDTWFKSLTGDDKIKLTITGTTVTAEALIDYTQLPADKTKFTIVARLYDLRGEDVPEGVKLTEAGENKLTEGAGEFKIIE